ncbi:iron ABC transporter permease [Clostridium sp. L74]|uniref:FecCD family ABC transporter permease n=1 Tax=Clostridium sp. L74 TaxID=1560217 RepID=UPI0006AB77D8|nr:iron ABC transporter permease [Clostridium sp. L74]KOR25626.1 ABC-type Fe3+-siderophore transport system, permease component [Clostridium sp. L74]
MGCKTLSKNKIYNKIIKKKIIILISLFIILILSIIAAIFIGSSSIGFKGTFYVILSTIFKGMKKATGLDNTVILQIRFPRVITAVIIGAALAGCGAVMQGILRNPLVSPYTLGLSSGSAFGAAIGIILGSSIVLSKFILLDKYFVILSSFIFGLITMFLVYFIAKKKAMSTGTLILAGVAIGYVFSALLSILKYTSNKDQLQDIVFWLMGGLWVADWTTVAILFVINSVCIMLMIKYAWDLNALASGEEIATSLGINVNRIRIICLTLCSLSTSSCIAFTGIIGFIGLVAPHISRIIIGNDYRFLIPCSCLMGSIILLISDTIGRTIISPTEIPVGIITSLIGAPFFIYLIIKERRRCWC